MSTATRSEGSARSAASRPAPPVGIASFPPVLAENPYQRLLYDSLAAHGYAEVGPAHLKVAWLLAHRRHARLLHFHWPHAYFLHRGRGALPGTAVKLGLFAARLAVARLAAYRIAWTIHQVMAHEPANRRLELLGARLLARAADVLIAHDAPTAEHAARALGLPASRVHVIPHGSYDGAYPPGRSRPAVRRELGIPEDAVAFLCFGHLRAYKGVALVLEAFDQIPPPAVLVIAGLPLDDRAAEAVRSAAARNPRVRALLRFVPDEAVAELFGACDIAIGPRSDGGTSGAIMLGLTLGLPVVTADVPGYTELTGGEAAGWLFRPYDLASLRCALGAAVGASRDERAARAAAARAAAARLSWESLGRRTARLFDGAVGRRAGWTGGAAGSTSLCRAGAAEADPGRSTGDPRSGPA